MFCLINYEKISCSKSETIYFNFIEDAYFCTRLAGAFQANFESFGESHAMFITMFIRRTYPFNEDKKFLNQTTQMSCVTSCVFLESDLDGAIVTLSVFTTESPDRRLVD